MTADYAGANPSDVPLAEASAGFLRYIKYEKGLARETIYNSSSWLNTYRKWLIAEDGQEPSVNLAFQEDVLRKYLYHLGQRNYRPRSIRSAFYPLRGMGEWLSDPDGYMRLLAVNTAKKIKTPKMDAPDRPMTKDTDITAMIAACYRIHPPRRAALCRAVVYVMACCGFRRGDLLDLKVSDVELDVDKSITVRHGKGSKRRKVYPPEECLQAIRAYLALRPAARHDWLWAIDVRRRLHDEALATLLAQVRAAASLDKDAKITTHAMRRSASTRLLRNGADIKDIQQFLGHSSLMTTIEYLFGDEERQRRLADIAAPPLPPAESPPTEAKSESDQHPQGDAPASTQQQGCRPSKKALRRWQVERIRPHADGSP